MSKDLHRIASDVKVVGKKTVGVGQKHCPGKADDQSDKRSAAVSSEDKVKLSMGALAITRTFCALRHHGMPRNPPELQRQCRDLQRDAEMSVSKRKAGMLVLLYSPQL